MSMNQAEQGKDLIFEEKLEFMVPPTTSPTGFHPPSIYRNAHFLKPIYNPNKTLPKPPSVSLSKNPNFDQLKNFVAFKGKQAPQKNWDTWVNNLLQTHQEIWKKVGIFDAIRASTYKIKWHFELIIGLADKWCPETNTFVFRFGEATITLEDVMILGGFSVLGECVRTPVRNREFKEIKKYMFSVFPKYKWEVLHSEWMSHYMGIGGEVEHTAFLALWLSRYVFPGKSSLICPHVIPIAICLARGTRIALAPAVLAVIYRDLGLLKAKIAELSNRRDGCSKLVLWAQFQLVQLWVWERFPMLGPEPVVISCGEPRLARWRNLNKVNVGCLSFDFEPIDGVFVWRPYAVCVKNWHFPEFYCNEERMLLNSENGVEFLSFAKCLRPCELVGLNCIEQYLPNRVGMQFGMDQDVPCPVSRLNQSPKVAWRSYDEPFDGVMLYVPPKLIKGDVTVRYFDWWRTASHRKCENCLNCGQMQVNLSLQLDGSAEDDGSKADSEYVENQPHVVEQAQLNPSLSMGDSNKRNPLSCSSLSTFTVSSGLDPYVTDTACGAVASCDKTPPYSNSLADYSENMAIELFQNTDKDDWNAYMCLISGFDYSDWQAYMEITNLTKSLDGISDSMPLQNQECAGAQVLNEMSAELESCEESSETAIVEESEELMIDHTSSLANQTPTLRIAHFLKPCLNPSFTLPPLPDISLSLTSKSINVSFPWNSLPAKDWQTWVQKLQHAHEPVWRKAGIFDAIRCSTYHIQSNNELIMSLADRWCPETNTFIFPWGEVTVTLEDVMLLGGFSPLGESVLCSSSAGLNVKHLENKLIEYFRTSERTDHNVTHYKWMEYFTGLGGDIENAGCLSLWLARHVFQQKSRAIVSMKVLPIAARLSCGIKIALAPAVLASIYRDLTLLKRKIMSSSSGYCNRLWLSAPLYLVQVWAWERFPLLGPVPRMIRLGETRLARWRGLCRNGGDYDMEMCLDSARETFHWRPYAVSLENWSLPGFYVDSGTWVDVGSDEELLSFAQCLMIRKLVGLNHCIECYNPHRVALQFGFDQDIPNPNPDDNTSNLQGMRLYLPPRLHKGDVTHWYSNWWTTGFHSLHGDALMGCKRRKGTLRNTKTLCKMRQSNPGISQDSSYSECSQSEIGGIQG